MIAVQKLIQDNNEKRNRLTEENEKYYDQLLVFIRSHLLLSERQSEEVLMEMLDHLLLAQCEGKTAKEVFGTNPKAYAQEIVDALPKEKKNSIWKFGIEVLGNLLGFFITTSALGKLFIKQDTMYLYSVLILLGTVIIGGIAMIFLILYVLKKSAFEDSNTKGIWKVTFGFVIFIGVIIGVLSLSKELGPTFSITWYTQLGIGCMLLLLSYMMKRHRIVTT